MINEQQEMFAIASPCVGICQVNNKGYCIGCYRNRNERLYWHTFNDSQRGLLLTILAARRAAYERKKAEKGQLPESEMGAIQGDLFADEWLG
ncbi:MAG: DUF1289 domain-containing protein [Alysiella sp.]|uniref:DUF1289 domain-containing protein n=1 Tax=Alysiella sp. TaxID=1872483 RepID=UPI0026DD1F68|nr:DUF1289 domain-containing protein [Alysiella sp.]MDO4433489.1 DUF1289 domain-containing protein [Alysiella sp.]